MGGSAGLDIIGGVPVVGVVAHCKAPVVRSDRQAVTTTWTVGFIAILSLIMKPFFKILAFVMLSGLSCPVQ